MQQQKKAAINQLPLHYQDDSVTERILIFFFLQAKVELTWDENDVDRKELTEKVSSGKLEDIPDAELRKYVAYSSEEDDDEDQNDTQNATKTSRKEKNGKKASNGNLEEDPSESEGEEEEPSSKRDMISKYKDLLKGINEKENEKKNNRIEMEFSWGIGVNKEKPDSKSKVEPNQEDLTPFEKLIEKKRVQKKARKDEIKKLKKAQRKGSDESAGSESDDDLPDGIDLNDPYFAEEFATDEFADTKKPSNSKKNKKLKSKKANNGSGDEDQDSDAQKESELALMLDDDDDRAHFSLKKIQENENESKSRKRKKQLKAKKDGAKQNVMDDDFAIDVNDQRFSAIYSSHMYNIDPTDSHFKKTKAMDTLIQEKLKRKPNEFVATEVAQQPDLKKPKKDVALNMLVKSIKRKVNQQK